MTDANRNKTLVYILPGYGGSPVTNQYIIQLAKEEFPDGDVVCADMPIRRRFLAWTRAAKIVADQIQELDQITENGDYTDIIFVGHSMGAVLAQRILVEASSLTKSWSDDDATNEYNTKVEPELTHLKGPHEWHKKVRRLVLIAGLSKGWSIANTANWLQSVQWRMGAVFCHLLPTGLKPTVFDFRRGGQFIVQSRLRGLDYKPEKDQGLSIVQLVGSVDGLVSPTHSLDMFGPDVRSNFCLAEVPYSDHGNIINFKGGKRHRQPIADMRKKIMRAALIGDDSVLKQHNINREDLVDELPMPHPKGTEDIVFVIHGIRDRGYWTKKIAARIKRAALAKGKSFATRTPSYGYFPILPFLLPWYRLAKVEWLMDQYADAKAAYPDARIHYMGHSNGTYLCAKGLKDYPSACFESIMFAGSVVRPDFPWKKMFQADRVKRVFNAPATSDVVVALFPHGLRYFKWLFDLGGAGHVGFQNPDNDKRLFQLDRTDMQRADQHFMIGGHKSAREETHWDEIAEFIVNKKLPDLDDKDYSTSQGKITCFMAAIGTVAFPALLLFAAFTFLLLFSFALRNTNLGITWADNIMHSLGYIVGSPLWALDLITSFVWPSASAWLTDTFTKMGQVAGGASWLAFGAWTVFLRVVSLKF